MLMSFLFQSLSKEDLGIKGPSDVELSDVGLGRIFSEKKPFFFRVFETVLGRFFFAFLGRFWVPKTGPPGGPDFGHPSIFYVRKTTPKKFLFSVPNVGPSFGFVLVFRWFFVFFFSRPWRIYFGARTIIWKVNVHWNSCFISLHLLLSMLASDAFPLHSCVRACEVRGNALAPAAWVGR